MNPPSPPPTRREPSPPPTTTSDRERFQYVVTFSLQLIFLVASFVGSQLQPTIHHFIKEMPHLTTFVIELAVAFHLYFMFVLITTTIKQPKNEAILESLFIFLMNGGISYLFVDLISHKGAVIAAICWAVVVLLITLIKRGDVVDQLKLLKDGCFSCFSFLIVFKYMWNGMCVPVGAVIKSGWNGMCSALGMICCGRRNNADQIPPPADTTATNLSNRLL